MCRYILWAHHGLYDYYGPLGKLCTFIYTKIWDEVFDKNGAVRSPFSCFPFGKELHLTQHTRSLLTFSLLYYVIWLPLVYAQLWYSQYSSSCLLHECFPLQKWNSVGKLFCFLQVEIWRVEHLTKLYGDSEIDASAIVAGGLYIIDTHNDIVTNGAFAQEGTAFASCSLDGRMTFCRVSILPVFFQGPK